MKHIPFVEDVHVENQAGELMYRHGAGGAAPFPEDEKNPRPHKFTQIAFMLERIADAKFVENMDVVVGQIAVEDLRGELKGQRESAPKLGYWVVKSDDDYGRLLAATNKPTGAPGPLTFNQARFMRAIRDATTPAAETKSTNGAAVSATSSAS